MTYLRRAGVGGHFSPSDVWDGGGVDGDFRLCDIADVGSGCFLSLRAPSAVECGDFP